MLLALMLATLATPGAGIPEALAKERAAAVSALRYELEFRIPDARSDPIHARVVLRFRLASPHRIVLDFAPSRDKIVSVIRGGRPIDFTFANHHLIVSAEHTAAGENELTI